MQLIVWIVFCGGLALVLRNRLTVCIICVLILWFLVPTVGSPLLTGQPIGPLSFHAATWLVLAVVVVQALQRTSSLLNELARHFYLFLILGLVLSVSFLTTRTVQSGGGMVLLVDQMFVPVLLFLLILAAGRGDAQLANKLRNTMLALAAVVVAVAIAQWSTQSVIFYESGFLTQFWFNPETQRWMGTFDQPLALSLTLCALAPMVAGIRSLVVQIVLLALMLVGVVISQSRVGILVIMASVVYSVVFSYHRRAVKAVVFALLGAAALLLLSSPLVAGVLSRIADDSGSSEARGDALATFLADSSRFLFVGEGMTSSYNVSEFAGLTTTFESSFLMYAVDIGVVFAALYFGTLLFLVLRHAGRHSVPGLTMAGLIATLVPHTYSGLATRSVAGIVVWTIVAMIVTASDSSYNRLTVPVLRQHTRNAGSVGVGVMTTPRRWPAEMWLGR